VSRRVAEINAVLDAVFCYLLRPMIAALQCLERDAPFWLIFDRIRRRHLLPSATLNKNDKDARHAERHPFALSDLVVSRGAFRRFSNASFRDTRLRLAASITAGNDSGGIRPRCDHFVTR
jgi:hypothetical protein